MRNQSGSEEGEGRRHAYLIPEPAGETFPRYFRSKNGKERKICLERLFRHPTEGAKLLQFSRDLNGIEGW